MAEPRDACNVSWTASPGAGVIYLYCHRHGTEGIAAQYPDFPTTAELVAAEDAHLAREGSVRPRRALV